jgi:F0F1-type ATP synthase assembly protein I
MRAHPGRTLSVMVIAAVCVAVALGLVLVVEPAAEPAILLVGVMAGLILYGVMYVVERKHHW